MPQTKSRKKDMHRAAARARLNRWRKRAVKEATRAALDAAQAGDDGLLAQAVRRAQRAIDLAAQKGPYHRNTAARRKSRLMARINRIRAGT
jgi:small subunit ribosomal protein S20